jgi:hypothetical protein
MIACGCRPVRGPVTDVIVYCPLHEAAERLAAALSEAVEFVDDTHPGLPRRAMADWRALLKEIAP